MSELQGRTLTLNEFNIPEEDILTQIDDEYWISINAITSKRQTKRKDIETLYVPKTKKDKVNINSIYTTMQTLMSVYYNDRQVVNFAGRRASTNDVANNLNLMASFDYDEMELDKIDYKWNWDRFFFGVWLKVIDGWDSVTQTPITKVMSPLSWIPDPLWGFSIESHRWSGFEVQMTREEMGDIYFNKELINSRPWTEQDQIRQAFQEGRDINSLWVTDIPNEKFGIYHHYTIIDGFKYLLSFANERTLLIRMMKLEPVLAEEKRDPLKVMYPIAIKYYSPVEGDPYGISVPDLIRDKQTSESKLFNLTLITATRNALGDDKLYDPKMIKNIKDLKTPTVGGKYIAVNKKDNESLEGALAHVKKDNPTQLPFNVDQWLKFQTSLSTGLDANSLWISSADNQTATEAQITQKNANLRFILWTKIGKWWEKDFWKLWYRSYLHHITSTSKKVIRVTGTFGNQFFEFTRSDFTTEEDIDIKIVSESERKDFATKNKADFFAISPQYLADPATPEVGKLMLKRKGLEFVGFNPEEIKKITYNIDEEMALLDVELINANEEPLPIKEGQDHLIYMSIYGSADDNQIKFEAINGRRSAYLESKQAERTAIAAEQGAQEAWALWNIAQSNSAQQQSANVELQWQNSRTPSLADV